MKMGSLNPCHFPRGHFSPCSFAKCKLLQNSADHWCCAASWSFTAGLYTIMFRDRSALLGQSLLQREFSESVSCNLGWKCSYRTSCSLEKISMPTYSLCVEVLGWLFAMQLSHTGLIFSALEALAKVVAVTTPLKHFSPVSNVGCTRINGTGRLLAQTCLFLAYFCYIFTKGC